MRRAAAGTSWGRCWCARPRPSSRAAAAIAAWRSSTRCGRLARRKGTTAWPRDRRHRPVRRRTTAAPT
jgi:hypothetical protein